MAVLQVEIGVGFGVADDVSALERLKIGLTVRDYNWRRGQRGLHER